MRLGAFFIASSAQFVKVVSPDAIAYIRTFDPASSETATLKVSCGTRTRVAGHTCHETTEDCTSVIGRPGKQRREEKG